MGDNSVIHPIKYKGPIMAVIIWHVDFYICNQCESSLMLLIRLPDMVKCTLYAT
jgi:hypothetical protein